MKHELEWGREPPKYVQLSFWSWNNSKKKQSWTSKPNSQLSNLSKMQFSSTAYVLDHMFWNPYYTKRCVGTIRSMWIFGLTSTLQDKAFAKTYASENRCLRWPWNIIHFTEVRVRNVPSRFSEASVCLEAPCRISTPEKYNLLNCGICLFMKDVWFPGIWWLFQKRPPGQTTMLARSASKFCVQPMSPFWGLSHHDPQFFG